MNEIRKVRNLICLDLAGGRRRRGRVRSAIPSNHGDDYPDGATDRRVRQGLTRICQDISTRSNYPFKGKYITYISFLLNNKI